MTERYSIAGHEVSVDPQGQIRNGKDILTLPGRIKLPDQVTAVESGIVISLNDIESTGPGDARPDISYTKNLIKVDSSLSIEWVVGSLSGDQHEGRHERVYNLEGRLVTKVISNDESIDKYCRIDIESGNIMDCWQPNEFKMDWQGKSFNLNNEKINFDFNLRDAFVKDDLVVFTSTDSNDEVELECYNTQGEFQWHNKTPHMWLSFDFYPSDGILRYYAQPTRSNTIIGDIDIESGDIS